MKTKGKVPPQQGGCWFCYNQDDELSFDHEFDTYVHRECIEAELRKDPDHPEAELMQYLLEESK